MKKTLAAVLAALAIAGCNNAPKPGADSKPGAGAKPAPELKVGSYNIRLQPGDKGTPNAWDERKADMLELIRKLDLDAFGLQEVRPDQADRKSVV